jgi:transposase
MAHAFRTPERRQVFLLPPDMRDWLPRDDMVHLIVDAVSLMDLSAFEAQHKLGGAGQAPFAPAMLLAVLIYAYSHGVRSSRAIERLCGRDAGYRFLVAEHVPDHTVIARFRRRHVDKLEAIFIRVLEMCRDAGLIRLGLVVLDGTKVKANAALEANRSAATIGEQVGRMMAEAETTDTREDRLFGPEGRDTLPKALARREERLVRLRACQAKLERQAADAAARQQAKIVARAAEEQAAGKRRRGRKPKPANASVDPDRVANPTDPDSGIMKTRHGWIQGYNAQAVVTPRQIILAAELTTEANDVQQLTPMLDLAQAVVELVIGEDAVLGAAVADAGYWSEANADSQTEECELFIATRQDRQQRTELRDASPPRGRIPKALSARGRMRRKLRTKRGRAIYRQRGAAVEPVFGQMKDRQGADHFSMRGLAACRGEWHLHAAVHNLRKLYRESVRRAAPTTPRRRSGKKVETEAA